jgi:hypothetical protein
VRGGVSWRHTKQHIGDYRLQQPNTSLEFLVPQFQRLDVGFSLDSVHLRCGKFIISGGLPCILFGRHVSKRTVRPDVVIVVSPGISGLPGIGQNPEPVFVQAVVSERAVKALDKRFLRLAGLNEAQLGAAALAPACAA